MEKIYRQTIYGVDLAFYSGESEEDTERILSQMKNRLSAVMEGTKNMSIPKAALLTCLNLCEEIEKYKTTNEGTLSSRVKNEDKLKKAITEKEAAERKCDDLQQEILSLKLEISNLKS